MVHLISGGEPGRAVEMSVTPARPGATVPCAERGTQKETRCRTGRLVGHRDGRGDGECGHHHDRPRATARAPSGVRAADAREVWFLARKGVADGCRRA